MRDLDQLFRDLADSPFRRRQRLKAADAAYLQSRGLPVVLQHGRQFIAQRLASARPDNDGRQTPMRGHPIFVAQHATATCCRGCIAKWHGIAADRPLTGEQIDYLLTVIERWLREAQPDVTEQPRQLPHIPQTRQKRFPFSQPD